MNSPFGFDKPEDSPGFLLWQTTITWQRLIKKGLDSYGVSHAQFVNLAILLWFDTTQQQPTQVILANWCKLDKMTVSKSLKSLAAQGYVERVEYGQDTRAKKVSLTSAGKALACKLVPIVEGIDKKFFDGVVESEQRALIHILNKLIDEQKENP